MLDSQEAPHSRANVDESKPQTEGSCIRTPIRAKSKGVAPSTRDYLLSGLRDLEKGKRYRVVDVRQLGDKRWRTKVRRERG
jgi:hypothetical protein